MFHPASRGGVASSDDSSTAISAARSPIRHKKMNLMSPRRKRPGPHTKWHEQIKESSSTNNWEAIRSWLAAISASSHDSSGFDLGSSKASMTSSDTSQRSTRTSQQNRGGFWNRLIKGNGTNVGRTMGKSDRFGLLSVDEDNRTPLHILLKLCSDQSIILSAITAEPRAAAVPSSKHRLALHFAVVHRHGWPVIAAVIDAHPAGLSSEDSKGMTPLQYAIAAATRESSKSRPPPTYWMQLLHDEELPYDATTREAHAWQESQKQRWAVVHWLLLSSATHPQSSLSLGGTGRQNKPMLVEALVHAAPPAVVSLLIGASVMMLSYDRKVTAFAASTLYTCITRHYPAPILKSLANQLLVFRENGGGCYDRVRDETGVGFVAAQYISGCFAQSSRGEWALSEHFFGLFEECIEDGEIESDELALSDWWQKIEHLLTFCVADRTYRSKSRRKNDTDNERQDSSSQLPQKYLLHAALSNTDTPPLVVRALLAFYPESIHVPYVNRALPIHLAAQVRDYLPRYYERSAFLIRQQPETALSLVLKAHPPALWKRWNGLLPFHCAVTCGRTMDSLRIFLDRDPRRVQLTQRDPRNGLYPFQAAAAYCSSKSDEDSFRWTCIARNKFSNAVWAGKLDRDKATQVLKVAEADNIQRLDTIFNLLRLYPEAILGPRHRLPLAIHKPPVSDVAADVRKLYLDFCYHAKKRHPLFSNKAHLESAVRRFDANEAHALSPKFLRWWDEVKTSLNNISFQSFQCSLKQLPNCESVLPAAGDISLLHRALMSDNVPPEIVGLLVSRERKNLSCCVPGTSLRPIHLCAVCPSYQPMSFEIFPSTSLELLLREDPDSAMVPSNGCLPLHMAIYTNQSQDTLETLIDAYKEALLIRDLHSCLFPFQLAASLCIPSEEQVTTSSNKEGVDRSVELDVLFCLLRRDPGAIQGRSEKLPRRRSSIMTGSYPETDSQSLGSSDEQSESTSAYDTVGSSLVGGKYTVQPNDGVGQCLPNADNSSTTDESSFQAASKVPRSPTRTKTPSSLMVLLSKSSVGRNDYGYDCDASVLSNIDVLSTLTSTLHTKADRRFVHDSSASDSDASISLYDSDESGVTGTTEGSNFDDFAEDSGIQSMSLPVMIDGAQQMDVESIGGHSIDCDVYFMVRRVARSAPNKDIDETDTPAQVTLSKSTPRALLAEIMSHTNSSKTPPVAKGESASRLSLVHRAHGTSALHSLQESETGSDMFKTSMPSFQIRDDAEMNDMSSVTASSWHTNQFMARSQSFSPNKGTRNQLEGNGLLGNFALDPSEAEDSLAVFDTQSECEQILGQNPSGVALNFDMTPQRSSSPSFAELASSNHSVMAEFEELKTDSVIYAESENTNAVQKNEESGVSTTSSKPGGAQDGAGDVGVEEGSPIPASKQFTIPKQPIAIENSKGAHGCALMGGTMERRTNVPAKNKPPHSKPKRFDKQTMRWVDETEQNDNSDSHLLRLDETGPPKIVDPKERQADVHFPSKPSALPHNPFAQRPQRLQNKRKKKLSKAQSPQGDIRCLSCNKANREVLMVPCKHLCLCRKCSSRQTRLAQCPLCGVTVVDRMLIF